MKKILCFLLSLVSILNFTTNVDAASYSSTISAYKSSTKYEYVDGLPIYLNKSGSYNLYVLDNDTYYEATTTLRDPELVTGGMAYIVNNSNSTSSSEKNYYITQVAILWYQDYLNGNDNNISSSLKNYITSHTSGDTVCYYINKLVNNAKTYANTEDSIIFEDKDITFTKNGNYYYSNVIDVTTNNLYSNPSVKLYNAPTSATIINNTVTKDGDGSFQIRIPSSSLTSFNEKDFEVYITATNYNNSVYKYSNYGTEDAIYSRVYSSSRNNVEASLPVTIKGIDNTSVRIRVLDQDGNYISGIKYYIYSGDCEDTTCNSDNYIDSFTTTNSYTTLNDVLSEGVYTLVRKTNTSRYDLNEKDIIEVADTSSIQVVTIQSSESYENDENFENDDIEDRLYKIRIYNPSGDNSNVIKIYNDGVLYGSFRGNQENYYIELSPNIAYSIIDSNDTMEVFFDVTENGTLYVHENNKKVKRDYINLDNYVLRYPIADDTNNDSSSNNNSSDNVYTDEDGTIHIDNLDGVNSIDISQEVNTTTDVKVDWISNIIDCPPTSLSSTLKYIVGAIVLALGIFLTIKNVKKSKNNI